MFFFNLLNFSDSRFLSIASLIRKFFETGFLDSLHPWFILICFIKFLIHLYLNNKNFIGPYIYFYTLIDRLTCWLIDLQPTPSTAPVATTPSTVDDAVWICYSSCPLKKGPRAALHEGFLTSAHELISGQPRLREHDNASSCFQWRLKLKEKTRLSRSTSFRLLNSKLRPLNCYQRSHEVRAWHWPRWEWSPKGAVK